MIEALDSVGKSGLTGAKNEQGPLWPAKEIVALIEKVGDYLAERDGKKPNGEMGRALGGRDD